MQAISDQDYSSGPETNEPSAEQDANEMDAPESGSFFLSPDQLGGKECKAGDTISLKVLGMDKDGDYEVEIADDSEPDADADEPMADQMRREIKGGAGSALRSAAATNSPVKGY